MDERTHTRLSYLFASINHSPHLAERFIAIVQMNAFIFTLEAFREQIVGWERDHGPLDHLGLSQIAQVLLMSEDKEVRDAARVLAHELDINPPKSTLWIPGARVTRPDGRTGTIDRIEPKNPRIAWVRKDEARDELQAFVLDDLTHGAKGN